MVHRQFISRCSHAAVMLQVLHIFFLRCRILIPTEFRLPYCTWMRSKKIGTCSLKICHSIKSILFFFLPITVLTWVWCTLRRWRRKRPPPIRRYQPVSTSASHNRSGDWAAWIHRGRSKSLSRGKIFLRHCSTIVPLLKKKGKKELHGPTVSVIWCKNEVLKKLCFKKCLWYGVKWCPYKIALQKHH